MAQALGCPASGACGYPSVTDMVQGCPSSTDVAQGHSTLVAPTWSRDALASFSRTQGHLIIICLAWRHPMGTHSPGTPMAPALPGDTPPAPTTTVGVLEDARSHGSAQLHLQPLTPTPDRCMFTASSQIISA